MPYSATVFNVLIASPSDVPEERLAIAQSLQEWNTLHSEEQGKVLMPVMWETHSVPAMGDRPQGLINDRVVRKCDILIGAFWTRLGSPTGLEESGTVEEIKWFLSNKKPVMLYYSKAHVDIDTVDIAQYQKLKEFKQSIRERGIQEDYHSIGELREKLSRHLTIVMRDMSVGPVIDKRTVEAAKAATRLELTGKPDAVAARPAGEDGEVWFEEYTDRSFIVCGDTIPLKEKILELGGKWISVRSGGKAWMFSKRHLKDVAKGLKLKASLRPSSQP